MSLATPCPDALQLEQHLQGTLPAADAGTLIDHLGTCEACQQALESLAAGGQWLPRTARAAGQEGAVAPPCGDLIEGLKTIEGTRPAHGSLDKAVDLAFLLPSQQPGHLGRLMHYEITEVLARGGMGMVLKAIDEKLGRVVAIKVLDAPLVQHEHARQRFVREARAAAAVHHENVVTIYAVEEAQGVPFLVMEFISGVSLQERLNQQPPLDLKQILRIGMQTANGLAAAHAQGLIHRDVKPANILLENSVERVKLTDFGLARTAEDSSLSREGVVAGTPEYMSPEQARGEPIDYRSDLFGLGCVLYALCTRRTPFRAGSPLATLKRVCEEPPPPIREINPGVPDWLVEIIDKLLDKNPRGRCQSAAEVAELLGRCLAECQEAERAGQPSQRTIRGRSWTAPGAAGLLIVVGLISLWLALRDPPREPALVKVPPPDSDGRAGNDTPQPATIAASGEPSAAARPARPEMGRVLVVIASRDFWYSDLSVVWSELKNGGVRPVIASSMPLEAQPLGGQPGQEVTPDMLLSQARAEDFDGVIFCGGRGIEEYLGEGPAAENARTLIHAALAADGLVGAVSHGPAVLAGAGVLKGKQSTCIKYEGGRYVQLLEAGGAEWVDEPVVVSGRIICGRGTADARAFTLAFLQSLKIANKSGR